MVELINLFNYVDRHVVAAVVGPMLGSDLNDSSVCGVVLFFSGGIAWNSPVSIDYTNFLIKGF